MADAELLVVEVLFGDKTTENGGGGSFWILFVGASLITSEHSVAQHKIGVCRTIREAFAANTDALEHTVARELIEDERRIDEAALLLLVRDDAANKVRMCLQVARVMCK